MNVHLIQVGEKTIYSRTGQFIDFNIISFDLMISNSNDFRPLFMLAPPSLSLSLAPALFLYMCMSKSVSSEVCFDVSILPCSVVWFSIRFTLCETLNILSKSFELNHFSIKGTF